MKISRRYLQFIQGVSQNMIGKIGVALATSAFLVFLLMEVAWFTGLVTNAYIGLISYLALPMLFIVGLILIPLGWKRQQQLTGKSGADLLKEQFEEDGVKAGFAGSGLFQTIAILTLVNVLFMVLASTQTLHFMDQAKFCGTACHSVMNPEWQTYQVSSHANVNCVECHVGEGAKALLDSKVNGLWQMVSLSFNLYERPIPTPVHQLRPARETCEKCHWPAKHYGDELIKHVSFTNAEVTQPLYTTLALKIDAELGSEQVGVHWHIAEGVQVRYGSVDPDRKKIQWVEASYPDGSVKHYQNTRIDAEAPVLEEREMDCVDCHNRATHVYQEPETIVDRMLQEGLIATDLPYIRREALDALRTSAPDKNRGLQQVARHLPAFYQKNYPAIYFKRLTELQNISELLSTEYDRYIHPDMNIDWGVYPSNLGHKNDSGCFRCHHEDMQSVNGQTVAYDCTVCHDIFAYDSKSTFQFMTEVDTTELESAIHEYLKITNY